MPDILLLLSQIAGILVDGAAGGAGGGAHRPAARRGRDAGRHHAGTVPARLGGPGLFRAALPPASLGFLNALSQIGLVLFMFLMGLELDLKLLRGQGRAAVITSHASIIAPFFLGACLALYLYPRLSDDSVSFTALRALPRRGHERDGLPGAGPDADGARDAEDAAGAVTIAAAAVDDVTAWCILAVVIVVVRTAEATVPLPVMLGGTLLYVVGMLTVVRWGLRRLEHVFEKRGGLSQDMVAIVVFLVLASAWTTERLGVHAVFGAFLAGVVMPRDDQLVRPLLDRFHDLMVILFLPLFFAFTGLRTSISLITGELWVYCALIIAVAVLGKLGGTALAARTSGMSWRDSWAIGTLMNTRGLMELVVLNIGLDIGVISPALFAMMVLMALVTTFMTSPVLARIYPGRLVGLAATPSPLPPPHQG